MREPDGVVELCRRPQPAVYGALLLYRGNRETAEELTQETLARVWEHWSLLQEALRSALECEHERLECARWGTPVKPRQAILEGIERIYLALWSALTEAAHRGDSIEAVARRVRDIADAHGLGSAVQQPLPQPELLH